MYAGQHSEQHLGSSSSLGALKLPLPDLDSYPDFQPDEELFAAFNQLESNEFGKSLYHNDYLGHWPTYGYAPSTADEPVQPGGHSNSIDPAFINSMLTLPPMPSSPVGERSPVSTASSPDRTYSVPNSTPSKHTALPTEGDLSDHDLYVPSENGEEDDDEWRPTSTRSTPSRKRRARQSTSGGRQVRSLSPSTREAGAPYVPTPSKAKRKRAPPPSRVHQATGELAALMLEAIEKTEVATRLDFVCPDRDCNFTMSNKPRMPDFRRHLKAHLRTTLKSMGKGHVCKGITMEEFYQLTDRQQTMIRRQGESGGLPYEYKNEQRIGGCLYPFSRGDALTRHVKAHSNRCIGTISGKIEGL